MPWIPLLISAIAALYQGYAQKQAADDAAKQTELNAVRDAEASQAEAEQERLNREANAKEETRQNARRQAAIRAYYAKSGVMMTGTPEMLTAEQAKIDELNVKEGDRQSKMKRLGIDLAARRNFSLGMSTADSYRSQGNSAMIGGYLNAASKFSAGGYKIGQTNGWWN